LRARLLRPRRAPAACFAAGRPQPGYHGTRPGPDPGADLPQVRRVGRAADWLERLPTPGRTAERADLDAAGVAEISAAAAARCSHHRGAFCPGDGAGGRGWFGGGAAAALWAPARAVAGPGLHRGHPRHTLAHPAFPHLLWPAANRHPLAPIP